MISGVPIHIWPSPIPNPLVSSGPQPQAILLEIPDTPRSAAGRAKTRGILNTLLEHWTGTTALLIETPTGPALDRPVGENSVSISITYCGSTAWIGLCSGGTIGIDAVSCAPFPELLEVASLYLTEQDTAQIRHSKNPGRTFAEAWARYEATVKCHQLPINETQQAPESDVLFHESPDWILCVAFPKNTNARLL
ncbi:MAG: 4'-phosphopantetheinyl transferase superfamily protein [Verrucomicrobiota bacterium]